MVDLKSIKKKNSRKSVPKRKSRKSVPKRKSRKSVPKRKSKKSVPKRKSRKSVPKRKSKKSVLKIKSKPKKKSAKTKSKKKRGGTNRVTSAFMNVVSQAIATAISFPLYLTDSETYLYSNKNPYLTLRIFAGKKLYDCINPFKIKDEYLQQEYNEVIGHKSDLLDINHRFFGILPYDYERLNSIFNNTVLGGSGHWA